jgi:DNA-binding IclR family transcriptional regulator
MVLEGNGVRFVDGVEGSRSLRCGTRIGVLMPAHVTSGGKALLAGLPDDDLRRLYPHGLPPWERKAIVTMPALARELAAVRRRGYATNNEESEAGIKAVGRSVLDRDGRAVGAVVIAIPSARCHSRDLDDHACYLQAFAEGLAAAL